MFCGDRRQYRCITGIDEYIDQTSGTKCSSTFQLQVDHVHPLALGGSNQPENLRVLCRTHNQLAATHLGIARKKPQFTEPEAEFF